MKTKNPEMPGIPPEIHLTVPGDEKKVLLHCCCAPCSSAIIECLMNNGIEPVIFYSNSNIFPLEEYIRRKDECTRYALSLGLEIVDDDYDHQDWLSTVKGLENEAERGARCLQCFSYRLLRAARYASSRGIKVLTTTLASSRWKSISQINSAGERACGAVDGVVWWDRNWRKEGLQERRGEIIKEMNFYNQLWCGCEFSIRTVSDDKGQCPQK